jgi:hypothetical protein
MKTLIMLAVLVSGCGINGDPGMFGCGFGDTSSTATSFRPSSRIKYPENLDSLLMSVATYREMKRLVDSIDKGVIIDDDIRKGTMFALDGSGARIGEYDEGYGWVWF